MPRKADLLCADCGKLMRSSLPQGKARCHPCRRAHPTPMRRDNACERCSAPARRRYCTLICANMAMRSAHPRPRGDVDNRRSAREAAAPGLTQIQRARLRVKWIKQARACTYCPALCEQVDHVIPLARGGTNYEGNLAPVCARCNRRKNAMLLTEWRMRGHAAWAVIIPLPREPRSHRTVKPVKQPHSCPVCDMPTLRTRYCTNACMLEANARRARDRYRIRVGLPVNIGQQTRPSRPRAA